MTRFQQEISGQLGEFWLNHAMAELDEVRKDLECGYITIDENGVAYNKIGRVVMNDMLEKLMYVAGDRVNEEATKVARDAEVKRSIEDNRKSMENHIYTDEEIFEMRAAFGTGKVITNIITGKSIRI